MAFFGQFSCFMFFSQCSSCCAGSSPPTVDSSATAEATEDTGAAATEVTAATEDTVATEDTAAVVTAAMAATEVAASAAAMAAAMVMAGESIIFNTPEYLNKTKKGHKDSITRSSVVHMLRTSGFNLEDCGSFFKQNKQK